LKTNEIIDVYEQEACILLILLSLPERLREATCGKELLIRGNYYP
jgi:hypothetical protein